MKLEFSGLGDSSRKRKYDTLTDDVNTMMMSLEKEPITAKLETVNGLLNGIKAIGDKLGDVSHFLLELILL